VERLTKEGRFDYVMIESTGVGEPVPVAQTFTYIDEEQGIDLSKYCRLDCMVTVVDANRFWHDYASGESLLDRQQAVGSNDTRDIVDLLISQIEFCDVLVLNKCDKVEPDELNELEQVLRKLQPRAKLIRSEYGKIDPSEILNTGRFNFEEASQSAGWIQEMEKGHHTPETEEYGISSFVYERKQPFHPERLMAWMEDWPAEIVRAKGTVWLASRDDMAQSFSQAGPSIQFGPAGYWVAALPEEEKQQTLLDDPEIAVDWDPHYGDRVNKIVFIGIDMNQLQIIESLDACLLTEEELKLDALEFEDPFPKMPSAELVTVD
jgi:G3E family GTPase